MFPGTWLNEKGMVYAGLLAVSLLGVAYTLLNAGTAIVGTPFAPIDPIAVAALTSAFAVLAITQDESNGSPNGE